MRLLIEGIAADAIDMTGNELNYLLNYLLRTGNVFCETVWLRWSRTALFDAKTLVPRGVYSKMLTTEPLAPVDEGHVAMWCRTDGETGDIAALIFQTAKSFNDGTHGPYVISDVFVHISEQRVHAFALSFNRDAEGSGKMRLHCFVGHWSWLNPDWLPRKNSIARQDGRRNSAGSRNQVSVGLSVDQD